MSLSQEEVAQGYMVRVNDTGNPAPDLHPTWEHIQVEVASPIKGKHTNRRIYISFDPQKHVWAGESGSVEVYRINQQRFTLEPLG